MKIKLLVIFGGLLLFANIFASNNQYDGQDDDPYGNQPDMIQTYYG